jgi:hypothetical protein
MHIRQYVYIRLSLTMMAAQLQLTLFGISPCLFHFCQTLSATPLYLASKPHSSSLSKHVNNQIAARKFFCEQLEYHIFYTFKVAVAVSIEGVVCFIPLPQHTAKLYCTLPYYLRTTQPTNFMPNLCASWVHSFVTILPSQTTMLHLLKTNTGIILKIWCLTL